MQTKSKEIGNIKQQKPAQSKLTSLIDRLALILLAITCVITMFALNYLFNRFLGISIFSVMFLLGLCFHLQFPRILFQKFKAKI